MAVAPLSVDAGVQEAVLENVGPLVERHIDTAMKRVACRDTVLEAVDLHGMGIVLAAAINSTLNLIFLVIRVNVRSAIVLVACIRKLLGCDRAGWRRAISASGNFLCRGGSTGK